MGWKDWSYWLKGGIIGFGVSIIMFFVTFPMAACWDWGNQFSNPNFCYILFPIGGNAGGFGGLNLFLFVIYGVLIGWIVGKIKSR